MITRSWLYTSSALVLLSTGLSQVASGDTVYLATQDTTLFRYIPERTSLETFDLGKRMTGLHYDAQAGLVYAIAIEGGSGVTDLVKINNPVSGEASMTVVSNLSQTYGGITRIGDSYYAYHNNGAELHSIDISDPDNPIETYIGQDTQQGNDALAYDPDGDTLYTVSKFAEALYEVDYATADATQIGPLGLGDAMSVGAEWFGGKMYMAVQNGDSDDFEIGSINIATGLYTPMYTLSEGTADYVPTALAIIPEPGAVGLFVVGMLLAIRRMR